MFPVMGLNLDGLTPEACAQAIVRSQAYIYRVMCSPLFECMGIHLEPVGVRNLVDISEESEATKPMYTSDRRPFDIRHKEALTIKDPLHKSSALDLLHQERLADAEKKAQGLCTGAEFLAVFGKVDLHHRQSLQNNPAGAYDAQLSAGGGCLIYRLRVARDLKPPPAQRYQEIRENLNHWPTYLDHPGS